jgi:hypothetical protein
VTKKATLSWVATKLKTDSRLKATILARVNGRKRTRVLVGAAAISITLKAGGAVEGGIECVHIHIITTSTDI